MRKKNGHPVNVISRTCLEGLGQILFPNVCVCCGLETTERERQLCAFCLDERFEFATPGKRTMSSAGVILPEGVLAQFALWKFDKGGRLQQLMHHLKYDRLTRIGTTLGRKLGQCLGKSEKIVDALHRYDLLLVPVPLHYLKFRQRGFNQAFFIAMGLRDVLEVPICPVDAVVRKKNTRTQTGFSLEKRIANMNGAFKVNDDEPLRGKLALVVDDVFTTGSTTFELASVLLWAGCVGVIILTVAQA